jgi:hypothetical protein
MDAPLSLQVECSRGWRDEPVPERFSLRGHLLEVREVLDRWLAADNRYFKVRAADGAVYILRHAVTEGRWELMLFDSGAREETRLSST